MEKENKNSGKKKTTAFLLAFFLGIFGAHKFYLHNVKKGVLYAAFFWTGIPLIIGLIEAFGYVKKTDKDIDNEFSRNISNAAMKQKKKSIAILLAFFLGIFGAHKFYLHNIKTGVIYFAFCWTGIPLIIGLIEAIRYMRRMEQDIQAEFMKNVNTAMESKDEAEPEKKPEDEIKTIEKEPGSFRNALNEIKFRMFKHKALKDEKPGDKEIKKGKKKKTLEEIRKDVIKERQKKKKKKKKTAAEKRRDLRRFLEKAGLELSPDKVSRKIKMISIMLSIVFTVIILLKFYPIKDYHPFMLVIVVPVVGVVVFFLTLIAAWVLFYGSIDLKIYQRKKDIEEVMPDFLMLTSSNIRAGMPIDRALWFAIRPRFGVLAKEIEIVAKQTLSGEDLNKALIKFSKAYDSVMVQRAMALLIEGIEAGGEIGQLLEKIAVDIQETKIMKKEMAASVTTYVIFITFASIVAAPFLFALAFQLLTIIQKVVADVDLDPEASSGMMISLSETSITIPDFTIFAVLTLAVTAFFSAVICSIIKNGNIKDGIKFIPIYIAVTLTIFFIAVKILGATLGQMV